MNNFGSALCYALVREHFKWFMTVRVGPFALKNIVFTLSVNLFISYYFSEYLCGSFFLNFFLTLVPLYAFGMYVHYLLGIETPGSKIVKKYFVHRMRKIN